MQLLLSHVEPKLVTESGVEESAVSNATYTTSVWYVGKDMHKI